MADYSKEWLQNQGLDDLSGDFSIIDEFLKLQDGESVGIICEGYGFTAIHNECDECKVTYKGTIILLSEIPTK